MAKKNTVKKVWVFLVWLASVIAALGIGGLFIKGGFMSTFLSIFPLLIHQLIGWVLIISAGLGVFWKLAGMIK